MENYIRKEKLFEPGAHLIVGVSGGADSLCLLFLLYQMSAAWRLTLTPVHIHHGIRGQEADRDAAFVRTACEECGLRLITVSVPVPQMAMEQGMTLEEAGREARYQVFHQLLTERKADRIVVAHHRDDNVETILLHLLRGSGMAGMRGMQPQSGQVIRPLLCMGREEIEEWLRQRDQVWVVDSTNLLPDATRNRLRLEIIPELLKIQPNLTERLLKSARQFAQAEAYLEEQAEAFLARQRHEADAQYIRKEDWIKLPPVLQSEVVYQALCTSAGQKKDLAQVHVELVQELFAKQCGRQISLPYDLRAKRDYEGICLYRADCRRTVRERHPQSLTDGMIQSVGNQTYRIHLHIGTPADLANFQFEQNDYTKCFDYDRIRESLVLRTRDPGDRIQVYVDGGHKRLQDFLTDQKIPARKRDQIPLLAVGSEILWIVGYRVSEGFHLNGQTRTCLWIRLEPVCREDAEHEQPCQKSAHEKSGHARKQP